MFGFAAKLVTDLIMASVFLCCDDQNGVMGIFHGPYSTPFSMLSYNMVLCAKQLPDWISCTTAPRKSLAPDKEYHLKMSSAKHAGAARGKIAMLTRECCLNHCWWLWVSTVCVRIDASYTPMATMPIKDTSVGHWWIRPIVQHHITTLPVG